MKTKHMFYWFPASLISFSLACSLSSPAPQVKSQIGSQVATGAVTVRTQSPQPSTTPETSSAGSTPLLVQTTSTPIDAVVVDTFAQEVYPFKQNGNCSLGEAIWAIQTQEQQDNCVVPSGSTTIYLPAGTYNLTEPDTSSPPLAGAEDRFGFDPGGFPVIYTKVSIMGNGSIIQRSGSKLFGIFQVTAQGDLNLSDLSLSGGDNSNKDLSEGGAIDVLVGKVNLNHVTLSDNNSADGGAIADGPMAILELRDSVVQSNTATNDGGGIYNSGTLMATDSLIDGNLAQDDSLGGGGIYNDVGQVTLDHCHLDGNRATEGGGIFNAGGTIKIVNGSVVSANLADEANSDIPHGGGGINNLGDSGQPAQVIIQDSFILANQAPQTTGGGIFNQGSLKVTNSVLGYNLSGGGGALYNDLDGLGSISGSCLLANRVQSVTPTGVGNGIENGSNTPFEASGNWWGSASGPGIGVSKNVSVKGFLTAPPTICEAGVPTPAVTPVGK